MKYTGERLIPEHNYKELIYAEHVNRYLFASQFVKGKHVLDIASGSGYGASLLLEAGAKSVVGVDISSEAVDYANQHYARENCSFEVGDAQEIPLEDGQVDVVISFETIEHVPDYELFLAEVRRVLKPGGLLVLSTPNKDLSKEDNEFHVKEFTEQELNESLKNIFTEVAVEAQTNFSCNTIYKQKEDLEKTVTNLDEHINFPKTYFVALAADDLSKYKYKSYSLFSSVYDAELENLRKILDQVIADKDVHIRNIGVLKDKAESEVVDLKDRELIASLRAEKVEIELEKLKEKHEKLRHFKEDALAIQEILKTVKKEQAFLARERASLRKQVTELKQQILKKEVHIRNLEARQSSLRFKFAYYLLLALYPLDLLWRVLLVCLRSLKLAPLAFKICCKEGPRSCLRLVWNYLRTSFRASDLVEQELDQNKLYQVKVEKEKLRKSDLFEINKNIKKFNQNPLISIIVPVYNVSPKWLNACIESVTKQLYEHWELCLVDDCSTKTETKKALEAWKDKDDRIKIQYLEKNQGIAKASNEAIKLASGEYIALLDNDDELTQDALYEVVKLINKHPEADFIYSDEDKLNEKGERVEPYFKSDWNPDLFLSNMYTCHLGVYRKSLVDEIGGFREGFDSSQDYDLVLRLTEKTDKIFHIPKVLYHWRKVKGSTSANITAKSDVKDSSLAALETALRRRNIKGKVLPGIFPGSYRVKRELVKKPLVSVIIPFRDEPDVLKTCLNSLKKTSYPDYEVLLVNNKSSDPETKKYLDSLKEDRYRIINYDKPFNFSAINNFAVSEARGEVLVFMNNDIEIIKKGWLEAMLEHAQRPEVGVVGTKLLFPDGRVQHGGVLLGIGNYKGRTHGVAGHAHKFYPGDHGGYFYRLSVIQNFSAVTGALMAMRKEVFTELGDFNEKDLKVAFNDIDLCLRAREKGYLVVYTPYAESYHHESLSRGGEDSPQKKKRFENECNYMYKRWGDLLKSDPYYNRNLSLKNENFGIKEV